MADNTIYTPSNIFTGIDFGLDTEHEVFLTNERDGITYREFYFSGRDISGKRPRGYGVLATRQERDFAPLLVLIGDVSHSVDYEVMAAYSADFNVFMFDYAGEDGKKTKFTFYPQQTDYANYSRSGRHFKFADVSARETCLFEWAALSCYAISAAKKLSGSQKTGVLGTGTGADIVWMLSSFDKSISAACTIFSAGWGNYNDIYKYSEENPVIIIDEERERYLAGISAEAYAKFVIPPMLYISSTNCRLTQMERSYDTISRIPDQASTLLCISPRLSCTVGFKNTRNISLFFKKYLCEGNFALPKRPLCAFENADGKVQISVSCENIEEVETVSVYFCENQVNPSARNWYELKVESAEGKFTAYPKVYLDDSYVFAYANVTYKNGFTVSSNFAVKKVSELGVSLPQYRRSPVIYNSVMDKDCFTVYAHYIPKLSDMFLDEYSVSMLEGPGGISGITSKRGKLATYKVGDNVFRGHDDESFKFDVYSPEAQELSLCFLDKAGTPAEHFHSCKIKLIGGNIWQPVEIKKQNLKSAEGQILRSWEDVSLAVFEAEKTFALNNMLWI